MHCLFCNSPKIQKAVIPRTTNFNDKFFTYHQCRSCGLVFIDPVPAVEDYKIMYNPKYHTTFYFKEIVHDYGYLDPLLNELNHEKKLLDYGCGDGSFLQYFFSKGYQCFGTEYDPVLVKQLKEKKPGMNFYSIDDFWQQTETEEYNIIHLGDVLEHLDKPAEFLKKLSGKLKKSNGILLVEGPLENNKNLAFFFRYISSMIMLIVNPSKKVSHVPYHVTFSNARNQRQLFEDSGFRTLEFKVYESAWPYPAKPGKSPGSRVKFFIAKISIALSGLFPFLKMGNRFIYTGTLNTVK